MEEESNEKQKLSAAEARNTLMLRLVCYFGMSYYTIIVLTLVIALIYSDFITMLGMQYVPEMALNRSDVVIYLIAGLILNGGAAAGLFMILRKMHFGLPLFILSALLVIGFQFLPSGMGGWQKYAIEILIILIIVGFHSHGFRRWPAEMPKLGGKMERF